MKYFLQIYILVIINSAFCQERTLHFFQADTLLPVGFVDVLFDNDICFNANKNGVFNYTLNEVNNYKKVTFFHKGYDKQEIFTSNLILIDTVFLKKQNKEIKEIQNSEEPNCDIFFGAQDHEIITLIKKHKKKQLKQIGIFLEKNKKYNWKLKIDFYKNEGNKPAELLKWSGFIIHQPLDKNNWVFIDLEKYNYIIPKNGVFIYIKIMPNLLFDNIKIKDQHIIGYTTVREKMNYFSRKCNTDEEWKKGADYFTPYLNIIIK